MAEENRGVLIDTSILIAHLRGRLSLQELVQDYDRVYISVVTLYELEYGAARAGRISDFHRFQPLIQPIVLPLTYADAERSARMNGALARKNQQIGPNDALIAGTALQHGLALLTLNVREFSRVSNLNVVQTR